MNNICLFGASGHGKVVKDVAESANYTVKAFIDDRPKSDHLLGIPVVASAEMDTYTTYDLLISIGNNKVRKIISQKLATHFATLIHASATVSPSATIKEGTVLMNGTHINANAHIGTHAIINTAAVIEHDCKIGNFVHVSPNATITGNVRIGEGTHIGAGATVIPNITIGKWAIIGAGAVIINDVPDYAVVVGNPGIIKKYNK